MIGRHTATRMTNSKWALIRSVQRKGRLRCAAASVTNVPITLHAAIATTNQCLWTLQTRRLLAHHHCQNSTLNFSYWLYHSSSFLSEFSVGFPVNKLVWLTVLLTETFRSEQVRCQDKRIKFIWNAKQDAALTSFTVQKKKMCEIICCFYTTFTFIVLSCEDITHHCYSVPWHITPWQALNTCYR